MSKCEKKFWFNNVSELFSNTDITINNTMSIEDKMNSLSRITIYIFFLLLVFKCKNSFLFLIFSLLIIIIIYYINKKQMEQENYEMFTLPYVSDIRNKHSSFDQKDYNNPGRSHYNKPYTRSTYEIEDQNYEGFNQPQQPTQRPQQPTTRRPQQPTQRPQPTTQRPTTQRPQPQQTTQRPQPQPTTQRPQQQPTTQRPQQQFSNIRSQKTSYQPSQKTSNYINMNQNISPNRNTRQFTTPVYLFENETKNNVILDTSSSYILGDEDVIINPNDPNYVSKNQRLTGAVNPRTLIAPVIAPPITDLDYWKTNNLVTHSAINDQKQTDIYLSGYQVTTDCKESDNLFSKDYNFKESPGPQTYLQRSNSYASNKLKNNSTPVENFSQVKENYGKYPYLIAPKESGQINTSCGYDSNQLKVGLPSNLKVGNCTKDPIFKDYNDNLFTQTIQPGVYTRNEINEPINSNIGISFDQQFLPTTYEIDDNNIIYTKHDPRVFDSSVFDDEPEDEGVNAANVYDPRFSGYGTSYRSYTDDNIGQTRFYYDDIDSVRMPNYISRSNIDFALFADSYGPMTNKNGNVNTDDIRKLADKQFLDSALEFRTGMQERLMRKTNANAWQQRVAPITKNSQRMLGGTRI